MVPRGFLIFGIIRIMYNLSAGAGIQYFEMWNSLEQLIASNPSLQSQFKHAEQSFKEYLQMAIYSNLDVSEPIIPTINLKDQDNNPIILYLDNPSADSNIFEKLYFSLIRKLNELPENSKYSIAVVDRKATLEVFVNFVNLLRMIPLRYIQPLSIILLSEKHLNKEEFGRQPFEKYVSKITTVFNSIQKLSEYKLDSLVSALKSQGIDSLSPKSIKSGVLSYRKNFVDRSNRNSLDVDEIFETKRHPTLVSYQLDDGVPKVLIELVETLKSKIDTPGLFRISPNVEELKRYSVHLDQQNLKQLSEIENPHLITSLIKKIFSCLQPPLFSYELYQFITLQQFQGQSGLYLILSMLKKLPQANYESLKFLLKFIYKDVLRCSESNKMKSGTLAVILAPVFLRSYNPSHDDLKHMNKMMSLVKTMIDNSEFLFQEQPKTEQKQTKPHHILQHKPSDQQDKVHNDNSLPEKNERKQPHQNPQQKVDQTTYTNQPQATETIDKQVGVGSQLITDKTVTIAVSLSEDDRISNSAGKSSVGQVIEYPLQSSFGAGLRSLNKKRSVKQSRESKISTEESSNKLGIGSCEVLQLQDEILEKAAEESLSDFEKIQQDEV